MVMTFKISRINKCFTIKKIIKLIGKNILDPKDFIQRLEMNKLKKSCMYNFDDGLKSQIDIAEPILKSLR